MSLSLEQRAQRKTGLGSSDAGAIAGVSPYASAFDVWARFHVPGDVSFAGEAADWGNRLEPVIAERFAQDTGVTLVDPTETFRHPKHDWMIAHPDRLSADGRILIEVKTAGIRQAHRWGDTDSDEIPDEYRLQVAHQMAVLPFVERAFIPVLIGGQDYRVYEIERDLELEEMLIAIEREFWTNHVLTAIAPSVVSSPNAGDWLARLHPRATLPEIEPGCELVQFAREYVESSTRLKDAEAAKRAAGDKLRALLGESSGARWGQRSKVTWTNNADKPTTDWEGVARAAGATPELIAAHTHITSGARVLRVSVKD